MDILEKSVLATIIYCDVLDFPMTLVEVFGLLINPKRISTSEETGELNLERILESLEKLRKAGEIGEWQGFYFLSKRQNGKMLVQERLEKNKIAEEKWKKAKKYVSWLKTLPYVEIIFASGSLALGHTTYESDLDVLVVAKKGRIWLARLLLTLAAGFLGVRRTKYEKVAPDKICLNHFITDNSLRISFESLYNAQTYVHMTPLYYKNQSLVAEFYRQNEWVKKFLPNCSWPPLFQLRAVRTRRLFSAFKKGVEFVLDLLRLGAVLDKFSEKIQKPRINTNLPGRIIASDEQLEFHPYSAEKTVLEKYNQVVDSWGIFGGYHEIDSGLK